MLFWFGVTVLSFVFRLQTKQKLN